MLKDTGLPERILMGVAFYRVLLFKGQKSGINHKFWIIILHLVWFWEPRTLQAPVDLRQMWEGQWPWSSPLGKKSFHTVSSTTCTCIHMHTHTHTHTHTRTAQSNPALSPGYRNAWLIIPSNLILSKHWCGWTKKEFPENPFWWN